MLYPMPTMRIRRIEIAAAILVALLGMSCGHSAGTSDREDARSSPRSAAQVDPQASSAAPSTPSTATQSSDNSLVTPTSANKPDEDIAYAAPSDFSQLSEAIRSELEMRGCRIPQPYEGKMPQNGIQGEFAGAGTRDVAVLCSRQGVSSILIFWNGSTDSPAEIAPSPDANFVAVIGEGKKGFSRVIASVGKNFIVEHHKDYGGPSPPPIDHDGIEDRFLEKGSTVHYFYGGQWLSLTGSD